MLLVREKLALTLAICASLLACEPRLVVGEKVCPASDAAVPLPTDPVLVGWHTGFENDFCDFEQAGGYCVEDPQASNRIVTSPPPHGGKFAAAFTVNDSNGAGYQSRCVRQGALPTAAYYGAWYYFPTLVVNPRSWNLFHFRGGDAANVRSDLQGEDQAGSDVHSLWDVSVENDGNGGLRAFVFEFSSMTTHTPTNAPPFPVGQWVHVQFYFKRAANAKGEVALYQDGKQLLDLTGVVSDDSNWGRWYVGDYSKGLQPPDSTIFVDDVSIDDSLGG